MTYDTFFALDFYPSARSSPPSFDQLKTLIEDGPVNVQPFESWAPGEPPRESGNSALRYSVHQREDSVDVSLCGKDPEVVELVMHLLQTEELDACLEADSRPILSQVGGQLRLDLQRFWTPELLQIVRRKREFVRSRVLYDFPKYGFVEKVYPDPRNEQHLLQAIIDVFSPDLRQEHFREEWDLRERVGFDCHDPKFLKEFWRLSECRLRFDGSPTRLEELRAHLKQAGAGMYLGQPVLPAIVIGGAPLIATCPPWVHFFQQQHGGYGCLQFPFSGLILPLHYNRAVARLDPAELLDGLEAMAEGPDEKVLHEHYPALEPLVNTHGDPYSEAQLDDLHKFISRSYRIPRFTFGREALLEFEDCDPLDWFAGWQMALKEGEPVIYNKETQRQLQEWYGAELKCYFLWNNSD